MATVTVYTAERMKEIEDNAVVDGEIVGDSLVLQRHNGEQFTAGVVVGPEGPTGPQGAAWGPVGSMLAFAGSVAPALWLFCRGQEVSRATYSELFSVIGEDHGAGDGFTTFLLPDSAGKGFMGYDSGDSDFDSLGNTGGSKAHTLTEAEMPEHTHVQDSHDHSLNTTVRANAAPNNPGTNIGSNSTTTFATNGGSGYTIWSRDSGNRTAVNQNTGGGDPHSILNPYLTTNFIIFANA